MAACGPELFAQGVRAVLGGWAALQLALAQGFGGPQGPEKAAWLAQALQDYFTQNADLGVAEVEDFLADVMDSEFDTLVEDGSLSQVSQELVSLFSCCRRGDAGGVGAALAALGRRGPALRQALANARPGPAPGPAHSPGNSQWEERDGQSPPPAGGEEEEEEEEEEPMEVGAAPPPPADGWHLVRRRRRR